MKLYVTYVSHISEGGCISLITKYYSRFVQDPCFGMSPCVWYPAQKSLSRRYFRFRLKDISPSGTFKYSYLSAPFYLLRPLGFLWTYTGSATLPGTSRRRANSPILFRRTEMLVSYLFLNMICGNFPGNTLSFRSFFSLRGNSLSNCEYA